MPGDVVEAIAKKALDALTVFGQAFARHRLGELLKEMSVSTSYVRNAQAILSASRAEYRPTSTRSSPLKNRYLGLSNDDR